jgi:hypothetical protein
MPDAQAFRGYRFPTEVILGAVRWYLRFPLSYRDPKARQPTAGSRSTPRPWTAGSSASPRSLSGGCAAICAPAAGPGMWTRPTSAWTGSGAT